MLLPNDLLAGLFGLLPYTSPSFQSSYDTEAVCAHPGLSCPSPVPSNPDTCCLNHPSGHFLLTQFWDSSPALGSPTNWTIHGLWPDYCAGGFEQFCDRNREHSSIAGLLNDAAPELLAFMDDHWLSLNGDNNHLWAHEWNKHGTCISTLEPGCYGSANGEGKDSGLEAVVSYFTHAATLYSSLNTFSTLAEAGIKPSINDRYTLADLEDAIAKSHGHPVTFRCHGTELQEIWYHYSVRGPLRHAQPFNASTVVRSPTKEMFVPAEPDASKSNCPAKGIRYLPKDTQGPVPTQTRPHHQPSHTSQPTGPVSPFSGRGHLIVHPLNSASKDMVAKLFQPPPKQQILDAPESHIQASTSNGCLIRRGLWYNSGSCATYLAKSDPPHIADDSDKSHLFTLSSLYAPCAVTGEDALFTCGNGLGIQAIFEAVNTTHDGETKEVLVWKSKTTFYADAEPGRFQKVELHADSDGGKRQVEVELAWQSI